MMEVAVTTGDISRAKFFGQIVTTNTQPNTDHLPFLSSNQQCQSTEGKCRISRTCLTKFEYPQMSMGSPGISQLRL